MIPNLLNINEIKKYLVAEARALPIELLVSVTSTNDYLHQKPYDPAQPISFCLAEEQTAGRGRFGKNWFSPFATNLYLSCRWHLMRSLSDFSGLSLIAGLAVCKAVHDCDVKTGVKIKWPNDILWQQKKLAGVLVEMDNQVPGYTSLIMGIGLNINHFSEKNNFIQQPWVTLEEILGYPQDRNKIAGLLIQHLLENTTYYLQTGLAPFLDEWQRYDFFLHQKITFLYGKDLISGIGAGLSPQGHLLVKHDDGSIKAYLATDIILQKQRFQQHFSDSDLL